MSPARRKHKFQGTLSMSFEDVLDPVEPKVQPYRSTTKTIHNLGLNLIFMCLDLCIEAWRNPALGLAEWTL